MSDRERWIVYPLLLLAIGLAMGNRLVLQDEGAGSEADVVHCKGLEVQGVDGKPIVTLAGDVKGDGILQINDAQGNLQSRLSANPSGAALELLDHTGKIYALVGHDANRVGLFAGDAESGRVLWNLSVLTRSREQQQQPDGEPKTTPPKSETDKDDKSSPKPTGADDIPTSSSESKESAPSTEQK